MPAPLVPIIATITGVGLFLGLAGMGGKKKKEKDAAPPTTTTPPLSGPPSTYQPPAYVPPVQMDQKTEDQWRKWVDGKVIEGVQSRLPEKADALASEIDAMAASWTGPLRDYALGGAQALRDQAASWRTDKTKPATQPPIVSQPPVVSPPPAQTGPPTPPPIQMPPATDWNQWIQQTLTEGATSGIASTAEHCAALIEGRMHEIPPQFQQRAREAVTALRAAAQSWRNRQQQQPPPVVPPVVVTPPQPPPPPPDPLLQARQVLADQMTINLKQNGGPEGNRYKEDQELVKQFQIQEGLTADGKYGVGTGLAVPKYGIVPARPYYFNAKTANADKARWKRSMQEWAARDPARASEWLAAMKVDNL